MLGIHMVFLMMPLRCLSSCMDVIHLHTPRLARLHQHFLQIVGLRVCHSRVCLTDSQVQTLLCDTALALFWTFDHHFTLALALDELHPLAPWGRGCVLAAQHTTLHTQQRPFVHMYTPTARTSGMVAYSSSICNSARKCSPMGFTVMGDESNVV